MRCPLIIILNIILNVSTNIKNIRTKDSDPEIDCKVAGVGMMLKALSMKKAA